MKLFQKQTQTFTIIWFVTKAIEQCTEDTTFFWILLFNKLKVCGTLASISVTFPTAFAHFVSLCYIYYGDLWSCMLLLQKDYDSLNVTMMVRDFFLILNEGVYIFLDIMLFSILNRLHFSVNNFYMY